MPMMPEGPKRSSGYPTSRAERMRVTQEGRKGAGMKPGNLAPPKVPRPYQPGPGGTKLPPGSSTARRPMLGGLRGMKRGGTVKGKK